MATRIRHIWQKKAANFKEESEIAFERHLERMMAADIELPLQHDRSYHSRRTVSKRATSFLLIVTVLVGAIVSLSRRDAFRKPLYPGTRNTHSEISSPLGSKTKLVLPDGTRVWLNAGSKLTYNEQFGITNRSTSLTGEAFFDVIKNATPFTIRANKIQIKVLGTAFNVKAYPDEKTTETSLLRGKVEVTLDRRPGETVILKPNEKLIVSNEEVTKMAGVQKRRPMVIIGELTHVNDTTIVETSWVHNELIFQDEAFIEVARQMERWYGVNIEFNDQKLAKERLSGTFTTETIQDALNALQYSTRFHYSVKGNLVTILK
ncbi:MAG: FecR family protein [Flavisolibacter sp.]